MTNYLEDFENEVQAVEKQCKLNTPLVTQALKILEPVQERLESKVLKNLIAHLKSELVRIAKIQAGVSSVLGQAKVAEKQLAASEKAAQAASVGEEILPAPALIPLGKLTAQLNDIIEDEPDFSDVESEFSNLESKPLMKASELLSDWVNPDAIETVFDDEDHFSEDISYTLD